MDISRTVKSYKITSYSDPDDPAFSWCRSVAISPAQFNSVFTTKRRCDWSRELRTTSWTPKSVSLPWPCLAIAFVCTPWPLCREIAVLEILRLLNCVVNVEDTRFLSRSERRPDDKLLPVGPVVPWELFNIGCPALCFPVETVDTPNHGWFKTTSSRGNVLSVNQRGILSILVDNRRRVNKLPLEKDFRSWIFN